ncbi:MAG: hotdog fold thioesterase [Cytophagaceae bacterium]|nr:hotdog fold thioesterase [Cytophagaceae bacterium]MDW8456784.1 hotdog fold thioesterase [Cytophagaceae bacterium]
MISAKISVEELNNRMRDTSVGHLGIEITEIGPDYICGKMPVDKRTIQPMGILHGGCSVHLAETLGSVGSLLCIDTEKKVSVGMGINANHVRSVREGYVRGRATLVHHGKTTHIWDIRIVNNEEELVCISRLTVAIMDKR